MLDQLGQARRLRPDGAGHGRPRGRRPPHGRGRRHRPGRGVPRRWATRPACAGSPRSPCPARRGAGRGGPRPVGPPVPRLRGRVPGREDPGHAAVRPAAGRGVLAGLRHRRRHHPAPRMRSGKNTHHIIEASFKGVARCLRDAVRVEGGGCPPPRARCDRDPVLDYGIGNLRSAQKALQQVGADARPHRRPGHDRSGRRGRAARGGRVRAVHGGAARHRARRAALACRRLGPALPRHLRRHADAVRGVRRGPGVAGPRRARRVGATTPRHREAAPDAVERARAQR